MRGWPGAGAWQRSLSVTDFSQQDHGDLLSIEHADEKADAERDEDSEDRIALDLRLDCRNPGIELRCGWPRPYRGQD
jgi:hypothetical protein